MTCQPWTMTLVDTLDGLSVALALLWFAGLSITVAISDVRSHRIPNRVVLPALFGLPVLLAAPVIAALIGGSSADAEAQWGPLLEGCLGALVLFVGNLLLGVLGGLGGGDVKLAAVLGMLLGHGGGWDAVLLGTALAWMAAGAWVLVCGGVRRVWRVWRVRRVWHVRAMWAGQDSRNIHDLQTLPFAPFLLAGAWVVLLMGADF